MIEFFVEGEPRQRGSKTFMPLYNRQTGWPMYHNRPAKRGGKVVKYARVKGTYVDSAKGSSKWMETVAKAGEPYRQNPLWDTECTMLCAFCYEYPISMQSTAKGKEGEPRPSSPVHKITTPDVMKLARAVEDALAGVIYTDDAKIVHQQAIKCYSRYTGVFVRLWPGARDFRYMFDTAIEQFLDEQEAMKPF